MNVSVIDFVSFHVGVMSDSDSETESDCEMEAVSEKLAIGEREKVGVFLDFVFV